MREHPPTGYPSIDKPWLKYYPQEIIDAPLPQSTLYEYIFRRNQDNLDRTVWNYYGGTETYGQMFREVNHIAGVLKDFGVKAGEVVTICMVNAPEAVLLILALNQLGAAANMVYGNSTPEELKQYLLDTRSTLVFTLDIYREKFVEIAGEAGLQKIVTANITRSMSLASRLGAKYIKKLKPPKLPRHPLCATWKEFFSPKLICTDYSRDASAPAVIAYTGGTTGGSKGAVVNSSALIAVAQQYVWGEADLRRNHLWLHAIPLFTIYGVGISLMVPLIVGMTLLIRIPMTETVAEIYKKFQPNHIMWGPAFWEAFADEAPDLDLSGLITAASGSDTLHETTAKKVDAYLKKQGCRYPLRNGYGMTEVGGGVCVNQPHAIETNSVGIPFVKNVIAAFDLETGEELPYGQSGELCIQTPSVMSGYVNNQEETDNIIRRHKDGLDWVHTGDLGFLSEGGFVHISGRLKRFILYGNVEENLYKKVFSLDIEKVLLTHPKVDNCAVVPMSDPKTGQVAAAFIILKKDLSADPETKAELAAFCDRQLTKEYRPAKFFFIEKFPLTKVAKVNYTELEKIANQP